MKSIDKIEIVDRYMRHLFLNSSFAKKSQSNFKVGHSWNSHSFESLVLSAEFEALG